MSRFEPPQRQKETVAVRRFAVGAEALGESGTHFRVWAPRCRSVNLLLNCGISTSKVALTAEPDGHFSGLVPKAKVGMRYWYELDDQPGRCSDPASWYQPEGARGPSAIVDGRAFDWTDADWPGARMPGQVMYEMHVGTFTAEGTWQAASARLPHLKETGITLIEMMPIAEFDGSFGWSYDATHLFAPTRLYGAPDDLRAFVDRAHQLQIGVILDVVYNHMGTLGNCLARFSPNYFSRRHETEWGTALNFDDVDSAPVRDFILSNVRYWIEEFHLDGFRIDATQAIFDSSPEHILTEIVRRSREAAGSRQIVIIAESEPQQARLLRQPDRGGHGMNASWNDDFHHSAMVALTGQSEAYYTDYRGEPEEFLALLKWGYLYQGQRYLWQKKRRGTPALDIPAHSFVNYFQNHDQIANSARGRRIHELTSPGRLRAMTALLLLAPQTPLLFQGQEFASSRPFRYFADNQGQLAKRTREGREKFLSQFPSLAAAEVRRQLADPAARATFEDCKLDFDEVNDRSEIYRLHCDLLRLRRNDVVFSAQDAARVYGARIGPQSFMARYFGEAGDDRLLFVNLGRDEHIAPCPQPLLAPPENRHWALLWSSESVSYGGNGTSAIESEGDWRVPGECAVVMKSVADNEIEHDDRDSES